MIGAEEREASVESKSTHIDDMHSMQCHVQDAAAIFSELIASHGKMLVPENGPTCWEHVVSDYAWFCLTKATKTLCAVDLLLTELFFEDAKVLMRCAYECYLNAAFLTANPARAADLVPVKVRLYRGDLQHPIGRSGKRIRRRILDPQTGEARDFQITIEEMANKTGFAVDANVHQPLYRFLSEFTHVHIIAIGAYANDETKHFTMDANLDAAYASAFLAGYCTWLLMDLVVRRFGIDDDSLRALAVASGATLLVSLERMEFDRPLQALSEHIKDRISLA